MASLKTVKKMGNKVTKIKCKVCIKHEQNIVGIKGFSKSWINGTTSIKKDSLEKKMLKETLSTLKKQKLGADVYRQGVVSS